ncbi:MAG: RNA-binding S4 domain-containing protein [Clostridiales bacterium]|jgi:ribosomal 50S subunit-recycling heat shock protein|nr:RNA-binding S4 domain-containing protein [Clostridiales bacterium]
MRLDKFLKVSRLIKRRTVANGACAASRVYVGGKPAKPSKEVKIGDILEISFGEKKITAEILSLSPASGETMYRLII